MPGTDRIPVGKHVVCVVASKCLTKGKTYIVEMDTTGSPGLNECYLIVDNDKGNQVPYPKSRFARFGDGSVVAWDEMMA
jgi:hypothetical protein